MTTYVFSDGRMVEKGSVADLSQFAKRANFPTPRVSRFEAMESPVTGKEISSWRERDRDMMAVDAVDRRDIPQKAFEKRAAVLERMKAVDG
jgi:hypothetical protein